MKKLVSLVVVVAVVLMAVPVFALDDVKAAADAAVEKVEAAADAATEAAPAEGTEAAPVEATAVEAAPAE
jgi:hypothetical protein